MDLEQFLEGQITPAMNCKRNVLCGLRRGEIELVKPEHCSEVQKSTLHVDLHSCSLTPPSHSPKDPKRNNQSKLHEEKKKYVFLPYSCYVWGDKKDSTFLRSSYMLRSDFCLQTRLTEGWGWLLPSPHALTGEPSWDNWVATQLQLNIVELQR